MLAFIVVIAVIFRFFLLAGLPPSLTWDEVSWGYNAFTLGIDGKDEFGRLFPLTYLESFGDFKPPLYAYLSVIPVKLLGLSEFSTRFASAFFGSLTVLLTFFLTKKIFNNSDKVKIGKLNINIPLLTTLLLAISPWHILLSRAAFEANVATFFIVLGVYLFLVSENKKWVFVLSILSFVLSMYTFNTARIVVPLLVLGLCVGKRNMLLKMKKEALTGFIIGALIFLPLLFFLRTPQAQLRFQEVNIFTDGSVIERSNQAIKNDNNAFWSKIIHNRRFGYTMEYLRHYFDNLTPGFLFIHGDGNPKFSIQDVGELYLWEIPFFISGILLLFRKREGNWWIIPYWLLVSIIPAATARETPHALRIETSLPTFQIMTAYGVFYFLKYIEKKSKYIFVAGYTAVTIAIVGGVIYFTHNYLGNYSREYSGEWQYGYKDSIDYIKTVQNNYDSIYFTKELGRPYIYFLYYLQYDPHKFLGSTNIEREVYGFVHVNGFDKYKFYDEKNALTPSKGRNLYVSVAGRVPESARVLKTFYLLNGNPVLSAYEL